MYKTNNFKEGLKNVMRDSKSISKGNLYDAFLEVTERYLNELISVLVLEQAIIDEFGEEKGTQLIEKIITSNSSINTLDVANNSEIEIEKRIEHLLSIIETGYVHKLI